MHGKKKIITIIAGMLSVFAITLVVIVSINFRDYSQAQVVEKSKITAELVRDGLTAHMINGIMDKREFFLQSISSAKDVEGLWVFRSQNVINQFGEGFNNEIARDAIDKDVLKSGKSIQQINENMSKATLRITIPYIASAYSNPNCLNCHAAKEGDVLGGITMVFNIDDTRTEGIKTLVKISLIAFISIFAFIYITNKLLTPYTKTMESLKESLEAAYNGDFSRRIHLDEKEDVYGVSVWLNTLLDKLEAAISAIDKNVSLFINNRRDKNKDPLEQAKIVLEDLAEIYKFKKTIELDSSKEIIYQRLIYIFEQKLGLDDFSIYEAQRVSNSRKLIYSNGEANFCKAADAMTMQSCRAQRTKTMVMSDEFHQLCSSASDDKHYFCNSFAINDDISIIINIRAISEQDLRAKKETIGYLRSYFENAKPVLESKILMEILQESNIKDGLTGLYNRKYLDEFIASVSQSKESYGMIMIDIDYFKMVNDTFGHDSGDEAIRALSDTIRSELGKNDIPFRFGGEEFIVFVENKDDCDDLANRIREKFKKITFNFGGQKVNKTLSAGYAAFPDDANSPWKIIKFADIAMYEAKESGRNKVVKFSQNLLDKDGEKY